MIYFLLPTLIILLFIAIAANKNQLFAPAVLFTASFCFCSIWATAYAQQWDLILDKNTYFVICGGVLTFILVAWMTNKVYTRTHRKRIKSSNGQVYVISKNKINILFFIVCFAFGGSIYYVFTHGFGSFSENLAGINNAVEELPAWLSIVRLASLWITNLCACLFAEQVVIRKKMDKKYLCIIILGIITTISIGGRTQAFNTILLAVCALYLSYEKYSNKKRKINYKLVVRFILLFSLVLFLFPRILPLLGRTSRVSDPLYYLAFYCGAEIKNLDTYIITGSKGMANGIWGEHTFKEPLIKSALPQSKDL